MRLPRLAYRNPAIIFGVLITAFAAFVLEFSGDNQPQIVGPRPPALGLASAMPTTDEEAPSIPQEPKPVSQSTAQVLLKLKPGMLRTEVEELVGVPAPRSTHPVVTTAGRVTYLTSYEADLAPPSTVRPLRLSLTQPGRVPSAQEPTQVALEFDATKVGHPLLGIHYPDPLF